MKRQTIPSTPSWFAKMGLLWVIPVFLLFLVSCDNGQPHGGGSPTKDFKMNCVTISRAQVQSWVDSGWTRPGDGAIKTMLLQFYSADVTAVNSNLQLIAYPSVTVTDVKKGGEQILAIDTTCKAVSFTGKKVLANNEANILKMGILNSDGSLKDFDYIRFTPQTFKDNSEYINFKVEVVTKGLPTSVEDGDTKPCPPWCD